jgi:hypothetical protein
MVHGYYSFVTRDRGPHRCIFLLSHMRSGSTLLVHLLISNPAICGYGETHLTYSSRKDLDALICHVLFKRRVFLPGKERFVLDKILHNHLLDLEHLEFVCSEDVFVIFLIREPLGSISSAIKNLDYSEHQALRYYINRLSMLERSARKLAQVRPYVFVTYEQLLSQTDRVFRRLQRYLMLQQPLSERYEVLPTTGTRGMGDFSKNITTGRIVRDNRRTREVRISSEALEQGLKVFNRCCATLAQCSVGVESGRDMSLH